MIFDLIFIGIAVVICGVMFAPRTWFMSKKERQDKKDWSL
jgi:hypothetical protein